MVLRASPKVPNYVILNQIQGIWKFINRMIQDDISYPTLIQQLVLDCPMSLFLGRWQRELGKIGLLVKVVDEMKFVALGLEKAEQLENNWQLEEQLNSA